MRLKGACQLFLAVLMLAGAGLCAYKSLHAVPIDDDGPIVVDMPSQDLGRVGQGVTKSAYFVLTNTTGQTAYITQVFGCSCLSHAISDARIPAKGSSKLRLEYSSGSARGSDSANLTVLFFLGQRPHRPSPCRRDQGGGHSGCGRFHRSSRV